MSAMSTEIFQMPADQPLFPNQPKSKKAQHTSSMPGAAPVFPNQPKSARHTTPTARPPISSDPPRSEGSAPISSGPQAPFKIPKPAGVPAFQMPSLTSSSRGKLIATLGVVALILGVIAEIIANGTGYHNMNKAEYEARIKAVETLAAECSPLATTSEECDRRLFGK
jgi:hypothetical protein